MPKLIECAYMPPDWVAIEMDDGSRIFVDNETLSGFRIPPINLMVPMYTTTNPE